MLGLILSVLMAFSANFTQEKEISLMSQTQISKGHLTFRAPDFLRWEYFEPKPLVWEVDGEKSNVNPQIKKMISLMMKSVSGEYLKENEDFQVLKNETNYTLIPKKREIKQIFQKIEIVMDSSLEVAKTVTLVEKNGDKTVIKFYNVKK